MHSLDVMYYVITALGGLVGLMIGGFAGWATPWAGATKGQSAVTRAALIGTIVDVFICAGLYWPLHGDRHVGPFIAGIIAIGVSYLAAAWLERSSIRTQIDDGMKAAEEMNKLGAELFDLLDFNPRDGVICTLDLQNNGKAAIQKGVSENLINFLRSNMSDVGHKVGFGGKYSVYVISPVDAAGYLEKYYGRYRVWFTKSPFDA